jgi:hypothetical protein
MKANPAAAAAAMEQAKKVMATPGMAEGLMQAQRAGPGFQAAIASLKDDPELKDVFAEIAAGGIAAVQRHWDNADLMAKISRKMEQLGVDEVGAAAVDAPGTPTHCGAGSTPNAAAAAPPVVTKAGPAAATKVPPPPPPAAEALPLHAAAKAGDAAAVKALLAAHGAARPDPDGRDAKGITALGTAVGFNRLDCVAALLEGGTAVDGTDGRGNTPLHYAAGYGRLDALKALLAAGADPAATNEAGQTPADAARANGERKAIKLLEARAAKEADKGAFVAA